MKVKHNKTLLILGILAIASFVAYVVFFVLTIAAKGGNFNDVFGAMEDALTGVGFKRLFAPAGGEAIDIAYCIVNYLFIAFAVIGSIYAIYLYSKTKHASLFFGILLCFLAIVPAWGFMLGASPEEPGNEYRAFIFDTLFKNKYEANDGNLGIIALTWFYLIFIVFSISFSISFFVLSLLNAKNNRYTADAEKNTEKDANEENDEASILAELEEEPFPEEPTQRPQAEAAPIEEEVEEDNFEDLDEPLEEENDEEEIVCDETDLRSLLQEIVKDAVKSELEKRESEKPAPTPMQNPVQPQAGLNNGGPIIVQYFNNNAPGNEKGFQPTNQPYPYGPYPYPYAPYPYAPYPYPYPQQPQPNSVQQKPEEPEKPVEPEKHEEPVKPAEPMPQKEPVIEEEKQEEKVEEIQPEIANVEETKNEPVEEQVLEPQQEPQKEEVEEPVVEEIPVEKPAEVQPEPEPEPEQEEAPVEEVATVEAEPAKEEEGDEENPNKIIRVPFYERILTVDKELQDLYSELKNELLSYGLKSRVAANGDTFRLHRKTYCRISVAGKSLKLHLALNPDDYKDSKMPYSDAGNKATYAEIPFVFKVKSGLSLRRAKGLIADVCAKDDLIQEDLMTIDWVNEIRANSN